MYTIEDLSNKKVALVNDGTLEELREVLSLAFPKDKHIASGDCKYYYAFGFNINKYNGTDEKLIIPTQSVKDFIKQIRDKEMKETNKAFVDQSINTYSDEKVQHHLDRLKQEMKEQQEFKLPNKWCIRGDRQEVIDFSNINGTSKPYVIDKKSYHHYPKFQYGESYCTTSEEIEKDYTEITFEQFKKYVLKEEMENKQEYELVDFKIEDLRGGETLVHEDSEFKIEGFVGNICFLTVEGVIINYTKESLKNIEFKLKVPKPKLEKIQGFEVREYPELPLVEVSDDNVDWFMLRLSVVKNRTYFEPFEDVHGVSWEFCRPVPKERRNFIEIED